MDHRFSDVQTKHIFVIKDGFVKILQLNSCDYSYYQGRQTDTEWTQRYFHPAVWAEFTWIGCKFSPTCFVCAQDMYIALESWVGGGGGLVKSTGQWKIMTFKTLTYSTSVCTLYFSLVITHSNSHNAHVL